jgi:hypothetical protein
MVGYSCHFLLEASVAAVLPARSNESITTHSNSGIVPAGTA